jgi:hypothetical protein
MDELMPVIELICGHETRLYIEAILAIIGLASVIARFLPSNYTNKYMDKVVAFLHKVGLNPPRHKAR